MPLDSSSSSAAISRAASPTLPDATRRIHSLFLAVLLFGSLAVEACTNAEPDDLSPQTRQALVILGSDNSIVGGVHALDGLKAFAQSIDEEFSPFAEERLNRFLKNAGIDVTSESVSIFFSIANVTSNTVGAALVYAPITESMLQNMSTEFSTLERMLDSQLDAAFRLHENRPGDASDEATDDSGDSVMGDDPDSAIYMSLIEDGVLLIAPSEEILEGMYARAHETDVEPATDSPLLMMASHGQFWMATRDSGALQRIFELFAVQNANRELAALTHAVNNVAISADLDASAADGPELQASLWISPGDGVKSGDLVDLLEGVVGYMKVQSKEETRFGELANRIEISERRNLAQITFHVSASEVSALQ